MVTGAASGIGEGLARDLASRKCNLILVDVQAEALERVAADARSKGVEVSTYVVDMGKRDAIDAFVTEITDAGHAVDLLINNAGVALGGRVDEVTSDDIEWLMNINFYGVVNLTKALLPHLKTRPDAAIANVSSVFGIIAPPGQGAYCASKFAVRGFTEALRHELANTNISVSLIHPGGIKTNIVRNARITNALNRAVSQEERDKQAADFEKNFITTPAKAATVILKGIEKRRARILIGPDAYLMVVLERLFPLTNIPKLGDLMALAKRRADRKNVSSTAPAQPDSKSVDPSSSSDTSTLDPASFNGAHTSRNGLDASPN